MISVYTTQPCTSLQCLCSNPHTQDTCVFSCNLPSVFLGAEWPGPFMYYCSNTGWNEYWNKSTESWPWKRQCSCRDSNPRLFEHESVALPPELSLFHKRAEFQFLCVWTKQRVRVLQYLLICTLQFSVVGPLPWLHQLLFRHWELKKHEQLHSQWYCEEQLLCGALALATSFDSVTDMTSPRSEKPTSSWRKSTILTRTQKDEWVVHWCWILVILRVNVMFVGVSEDGMQPHLQFHSRKLQRLHTQSDCLVSGVTVHLVQVRKC